MARPKTKINLEKLLDLHKSHLSETSSYHLLLADLTAFALLSSTQADERELSLIQQLTRTKQRLT